jgi:propanediol dehydratase small subunit
VTDDALADYPLGSRRPELVRTSTGRPLAEVTLDALRRGELVPDELRATAETLGRQAEVAYAAGRAAFGDNLVRAAELVAVPDDVILALYTALRPQRSTASELAAWADRLDHEFAAPVTAAFVREAAAVYAERRLLAERDRAAV